MEPLFLLLYAVAALGGSIGTKAAGAPLWKGALVGLGCTLALRLSLVADKDGLALSLLLALAAAGLTGVALRLRPVALLAAVILAAAAIAAAIYAFLLRYGFW